jgi:hypothetical protein
VLVLADKRNKIFVMDISQQHSYVAISVGSSRNNSMSIAQTLLGKPYKDYVGRIAFCLRTTKHHGDPRFTDDRWDERRAQYGCEAELEPMGIIDQVRKPRRVKQKHVASTGVGASPLSRAFHTHFTRHARTARGAGGRNPGNGAEAGEEKG